MNRWNKIAARVAQELKEDELINLGKGIPSFVAEYIDATKIIYESNSDVAILDAQEVDEKGEMVSYLTSDKGSDVAVVHNASKVIIAMEHLSADGSPKIRKKCTLPINHKLHVDLIITDMAVIKVTPKGLVLKELAPGVSWHQVQDATEANLILDENIFLGGKVF